MLMSLTGVGGTLRSTLTNQANHGIQMSTVTQEDNNEVALEVEAMEQARRLRLGATARDSQIPNVA